MRCIFCKSDSSNSKSVEHIIPESLGNKEHILEKGLVCDKCNQYFALKIERVVLEKPYFVSVRHRNFIENKKNKIPLQKAIIGKDPNVFFDNNYGEFAIIVENSETAEKIQRGEITTMILPKPEKPEENDRDLSRLLGKIAMEVLTSRFCKIENWEEEIIDKVELDDLRQYVRTGNKPEFWEYHQRRLYNEQDTFHNPKLQDEPYEVLHEFTLLYEENHLYLVIVIMGIEYALNFTDPKIDGYVAWLNKNNHQTPFFDPDKKHIINQSGNYWNALDEI